MLVLGACLLASGAGAAAPQGMPAELTERALRYLHGEGVERNINLAVTYLCNAARDGYGSAAYELAWLYYQGRGVPRDDALAAAWLAEAQRLGEALPQRLVESLAHVRKGGLDCIAGNGLDVQMGKGQHAARAAAISDDPRRAALVALINELAPQYDLDPALVLEVVRAESNFDPRARSNKGALGLMQLIPATARRFGVRDPIDPMQNLHGGMAYLRWLFDRFDGDLKLILAGYNAGEGAVERHGGVPPYTETREYVRRILRRYQGKSGI
ncbi:MAG TPA: transglycosylase SLT domain-containing protein [Pelomicrobium sp.]|nr:transglycosylase SLT domain-containing protein [Pelomicrobium sp.]